VNSIITTKRHGLYRAVWGEAPSLWAASRSRAVWNLMKLRRTHPASRIADSAPKANAGLPAGARSEARSPAYASLRDGSGGGLPAVVSVRAVRSAYAKAPTTAQSSGRHGGWPASRSLVQRRVARPRVASRRLRRAAFACNHERRLVSRGGIEPPTRRLRVCCSAN
jgi:hypothetical protein